MIDLAQGQSVLVTVDGYGSADHGAFQLAWQLIDGTCGDPTRFISANAYLGADALLEIRDRERYGTYRLLIVTDGTALFVITGAGDVLEPEHDVAAIGSGGNYALAAEPLADARS